MTVATVTGLFSVPAQTAYLPPGGGPFGFSGLTIAVRPTPRSPVAPPLESEAVSLQPTGNPAVAGSQARHAASTLTGRVSTASGFHCFTRSVRGGSPTRPI